LGGTWQLQYPNEYARAIVRLMLNEQAAVGTPL